MGHCWCVSHLLCSAKYRNLTAPTVHQLSSIYERKQMLSVPISDNPYICQGSHWGPSLGEQLAAGFADYLLGLGSMVGTVWGVVWRSVSSYIWTFLNWQWGAAPLILPRPMELFSCVKLLGGKMKIKIDDIHLRCAAWNAFTGSVKFNIDDKVSWDPLPSAKRTNA